MLDEFAAVAGHSDVPRADAADRLQRHRRARRPRGDHHPGLLGAARARGGPLRRRCGRAAERWGRPRSSNSARTACSPRWRSSAPTSAAITGAPQGPGRDRGAVHRSRHRPRARHRGGLAGPVRAVGRPAVDLPTYAFQRQRYWLETARPEAAPVAVDPAEADVLGGRRAAGPHVRRARPAARRRRRPEQRAARPVRLATRTHRALHHGRLALPRELDAGDRQAPSRRPRAPGWWRFPQRVEATRRRARCKRPALRSSRSPRRGRPDARP